jgi:uncharacterized protein YodC (DUF2158 family)
VRGSKPARWTVVDDVPFAGGGRWTFRMRQTMPKTGDLVRLRSGGPVMTVERIEYDVPDPFARCAWFDARELAHSGSFKIAALDLVDEEETRPPG